MPRVMINGVIWCKAEDDTLKAAVERHGPNEWNLIASLLNGKTVKQCKDRWHIGLDPSIKRNEWTREEDEKLMYLKKLMPNKRQTVSLIMGRSADQCTNRYHYLWFEAQRKEIMNMANDTSFNSQRIESKREIHTFRTGSLNREDNDMQRLPQARARLAIMQLKKNKRFAREKQIAVIRRLKHHQRMIERRRSERNRIVTYNSENSFEERNESTCFYDSSTIHVADNFSRYLDKHLDGEHKKEQKEMQSIKRPRENDVSIESPENDETSNKRSKVIVVPVPQYTYQNLHAFHDVQCKPGFDFTSNYHIFRRCDV